MEDERDTSDELIDSNYTDDEEIVFNMKKQQNANKLIGEIHLAVDKGHSSHDRRSRYDEEEDRERRQRMRADQVVRAAEAGKAKMYDVPGKANEGLHQSVFNALSINECYHMTSAHVSDSTRKKIERGDYVDFGKLLSKDKVKAEEDDRIELVNRGGRITFAPVSSREASAIPNLTKWEQAFRVFSDIYLRANPERVNELIEYGNTIATASQTYIWENVYAYDKMFRMHMGEFKGRSWKVILHQAWMTKLKDRIESVNHQGVTRRPKHKEAMISTIRERDRRRAYVISLIWGNVHLASNVNLTIDVLFAINLVMDHTIVEGR